MHKGHPNHLVDELDESDVAVGRLDLGPQLVHEVIVDDVEDVEGDHVLKLEEDRPVRRTHDPQGLLEHLLPLVRVQLQNLDVVDS